jgi:hypothetical protein
VVVGRDGICEYALYYAGLCAMLDEYACVLLEAEQVDRVVVAHPVQDQALAVSC